MKRRKAEETNRARASLNDTKRKGKEGVQARVGEGNNEREGGGSGDVHTLI